MQKYNTNKYEYSTDAPVYIAHIPEFVNVITVHNIQHDDYCWDVSHTWVFLAEEYL